MHGVFKVRAAWTLAVVLCGVGCDGQSGASDYHAPARFRITNDVVNRDVAPFTATIPGVGNNLVEAGSGFEPIVYRARYQATADSPDRIAVSPDRLSRDDTLREGFLDGADVFVYRISGGRFSLVREDRVATGGFHASGWWRLGADDKVVPPSASQYDFHWDNWNRPDAKYYFTVRAIDRSGNLSAPAPAVAVERPRELAKNPPAAKVIDFKAERSSTDRQAPPAPTGLRATVTPDGALQLHWDPVRADDLAGYVVYRSDYAPERQAGYFLQLARAAATTEQRIRTGDMIVVSKKFYVTSRKRELSNRVFDAGQELETLRPGLVGFFPDEQSGKSWALVRHPPQTPVTEPGETYLKLELANGVTESLGTWNHSGTGQEGYEVLEKRAYTVEVWLRREAGNGGVRFKFRGLYDQKFLGPGYTNPVQMIKPVAFAVGPEWKKFTTTFTPPEILPGSVPNMMELEFTGPGTFGVDNFRIYRADTGYLDLQAHEYRELADARIGALRTHGLVKTGFRSYDVAQLTNPGGVIGAGGSMKLNTLPQVLNVMRKARLRPWLQIEFHLSPHEWLAFVEYMAAPFDPRVDSAATKPWAYKRYAQGQRKPWTDEFDRVYFELGNETWNALFYPWIFEGMPDAAGGKNYSPAQVYGLYQEYVVTTMRSSPYWRAAALDKKFAFVIGGWAATEYGRDAARVSPSSGYLAFAAYNGGWDEREGPPPANALGLFNVLSQVYQSATADADAQARQAGDVKTAARSVQLATYEGGPGYALNGLNGEVVTDAQAREQEQVMKSLAAGTATLDSFLARAYRGFELQNFFMFQPGAYWSSHARWYKGGQAYPSWKALALFNREAAGAMLRTTASSVPAIDLPAQGRRKAVTSGPLVAAYATRRGERLAVVLVSRKMPDYPARGDDGYTRVALELPIARAKAITLYRMAGEPKANNLEADNVRVEKLTVEPAALNGAFGVNERTGADARGLPPAATFVYIFDGAS